jgi:hypothetical protein
MVGPAMPRPLYPPDAADRGKIPSVPGIDVIAVKRAVSRSGHWPWQDFDDSYSNGFAHGRSGNVRENGLAGLQRQNGIEATGWMGEHTYNLIRSARVPDGLPHAGEPLLDAMAVGLLESHAELMAGGSSVRLLALEKARSFLGYVESPPGSNGNMFGEWYGMNFEPWCAMFVSYCFEHVAHGSPSFAAGTTYAYVPYIVADARAHMFGLSAVESPIPGDLVCFNWDGGEFDHVGLFEDGIPEGFDTIEGNTSTSNNSNGGQVMRRRRSADTQETVFVRVVE